MKKAKLYTTTYCPFCHRALQLLNDLKYEIENIDVTENQGLWDEMAQSTGHKTVPMIFINDEFIGGCDDLYEMHQKGLL